MSTIRICDRCKKLFSDRNLVHVEFIENGNMTFKDYHIDCFNYEFSTDIRKIKGEKNG